MSNTNEDEHLNQRVVAGCILTTLLASFVLGAALIWIVDRDRNEAHYPGATFITGHSNYSGLPRQFRWDNSYFTTDSFTEVYNWYSVTFDLGAEARAIERCILLEGPVQHLLRQRHFSVLLCNAPEGQYIYITRTTRLGLY